MDAEIGRVEGLDGRAVSRNATAKLRPQLLKNTDIFRDVLGGIDLEPARGHAEHPTLRMHEAAGRVTGPIVPPSG